MVLRRSLLILCCSLLACAGGDDETTTGTSAGGLHGCDPLTGVTAPVTLGTVVAAGRAQDGTVYLVDRGSVGSYVGLRVFISQGGTVLRRDNVAGSGDGPDFIILTVREGAADLQLRIDLSGGAASRMAVYRGEPDPKTKSFDPSTQGEVLTLLSAADIGAFTVENIPGEVVIEFDATTADGHRFFVVRPAIDWSYDDFRVFYGTPDAMLERKTSNVSRGASTYISFDLDGATSDAYLTSALSAPGLPTLTTNGSAQTLTYRPTPSGAGLTFQCFR